MLKGAMLGALLHNCDALRRIAGTAIDLVKIPVERSWEPVLSEPGFDLRAYGDGDPRSPPVLIVPAPIKRPYIFDLLPQVSVVRRLLAAKFAVYLLAWRDVEGDAPWGLADYAGTWIEKALTVLTNLDRKPILIGHSLGGTFAAIFAASRPAHVGKLLLIAAPLRFGADAGDLARAVAASPPANLIAEIARGAPGVLLDVASASASPEEFVAERWQDAIVCLPDPLALEIHWRVIRWTLDEFALPARLFAEVIEKLYRCDAFARGELWLEGRHAHPGNLIGLPIATVIDRKSRIVPDFSALEPLYDKAVFTYRREKGVALQHVGPLVGREAHMRLWPQLIAWMRSAQPDRHH